MKMVENFYLQMLAETKGVVATIPRPWPVELYAEMLKTADLNEDDIASITTGLLIRLCFDRTDLEVRERQLANLLRDREEYISIGLPAAPRNVFLHGRKAYEKAREEAVLSYEAEVESLKRAIHDAKVVITDTENALAAVEASITTPIPLEHGPDDAA